MKRSLQDFEKERKRKEKQIEQDIKDGKKKITTLEKVRTVRRAGIRRKVEKIFFSEMC